MEIDNDSDEPNLCNYEKLEGKINGVEKWISLDKIECPEPKKVSFQFFFVVSSIRKFTYTAHWIMREI